MSSYAGATRPSDGAAEHVRRLAHELLPQSAEIATTIIETVVGEVPEVAPRGLELPARSTRENISAMLATLAFGLDPEAFGPPPATLELIGQLVDDGGDITAILRGYRVAHHQFWGIWSAHVDARVDDRDELQAVLSASSTAVFALFDSVVAGIVDFHREERARRTAADPGRPSAAVAIAGLLGQEPVDLDAAGTVLGYDLRGHHVAAVVSPLTPDAGVRDATEALVRRLGRPAGVACPAGDGTTWLWFGWHAHPDEDVVDAIATTPTPGAIVGLGDAGVGRIGFRRSHEQALEALAVRRLHADPRPGVVRHRDVALAAIVCADRDRARAFARSILGPLAEPDTATARLRETLRTFLSCGQNKARTAELLFVHQRTVSYRMARVEEALGSPVVGQAAELQAALVVVDTFGE